MRDVVAKGLPEVERMTLPGVERESIGEFGNQKRDYMSKLESLTKLDIYCSTDQDYCPAGYPGFHQLHQ